MLLSSCLWRRGSSTLKGGTATPHEVRQDRGALPQLESFFSSLLRLASHMMPRGCHAPRHEGCHGHCPAWEDTRAALGEATTGQTHRPHLDRPEHLGPIEKTPPAGGTATTQGDAARSTQVALAPLRVRRSVDPPATIAGGFPRGARRPRARGLRQPGRPGGPGCHRPLAGRLPGRGGILSGPRVRVAACRVPPERIPVCREDPSSFGRRVGGPHWPAPYHVPYYMSGGLHNHNRCFTL